MQLAFVTTGDTRPMPAWNGSGGGETTGVTRSDVYARYAVRLVGGGNVLRASGAADALRQLRDRTEARAVYLIGHGNRLGFSFAVTVRDDAAYSSTSQMLTSPLRRSGGNLVMSTTSGSYRAIEALARLMDRAPGPSTLQVRACFQSRDALLGISRTILHAVPSSHVLVTGYTDYYALVERSTGGFRSEIQRQRPDGTWTTVSTGAGTNAPPAQITFCVQPGQIAEGGCP